MRSVYLAGQYKRRDEFREYALQLIQRGVQVTSRWLLETIPLEHTLAEVGPEQWGKTALLDYFDVQRADTLIFFAEDSENQPRRGGRPVEFGMALALGKKVLVVGAEENIFH